LSIRFLLASSALAAVFASPAAAEHVISTAITPLKNEYAILADRGRPKSKNNLYRFSNPLMRAYVRLRMHKEKQSEIAG